MSSSSKMKEMVGGCCVCSDERGWTENPLVYCDGHGCNVAVHQACYGIVQVPTGPWFCRKCESQERAARVKCELCPLKDGALKRTDSGGWCHVVCALFIPEAWFANVQTMEPIMLKNVPPDRFSRLCYICEENNKEVSKASAGACMQCNRNGCKQNFHVTCAQAHGLLCEEAGNYGDNVKYCGYCSYHFRKLKKDTNIKTIPAFKPIPADNATPDSTPEKSYNDPKVNISAEHKNRESLAARQLAGFTSFHHDTRRSRESTPNNSLLRNVLNHDNGTKSPVETPVRIEKFLRSSQDKPSKSIPPDKGKPNSTEKETKASVAEKPVPTSTSSDSKVLSESKFTVSDGPGQLFSPLPEGQVITSVPVTTQVAFPTSLDGIISSMVNNTNSNNTPSTPTDSDASQVVRSRRSRAGSLDKDKKKKGRAAVQAPSSRGRASRASISEDNVDNVSPPTTKRSKQQQQVQDSIQTTAGTVSTSLTSTSVTTSTTSVATANSTLAPQNLSVFGGEPTFPNPIMKTSFNQVSETPQQSTSQLSQNINTVTSVPTSSASGLKISNGPLIGPPNPFTPSQFPAVSQRSKTCSETPVSMEELLEMQWEQGSNFLMEQGQHFDIASLLNCLHKVKSDNKKLEDYVRNLVSRRDHLLAVNARLSLPFGSSHISLSKQQENGEGPSLNARLSLPYGGGHISTAKQQENGEGGSSGRGTPNQLRIPNGTESISEDNSDDSPINVVDTPSEKRHTDSPLANNTHISSQSIRHQLYSSQKHLDTFSNTSSSSQITTSSNKESTAQEKT